MRSFNELHDNEQDTHMSSKNYEEIAYDVDIAFANHLILNASLTSYEKRASSKKQPFKTHPLYFFALPALFPCSS
jgi:hypothetical protein